MEAPNIEVMAFPGVMLPAAIRFVESGWKTLKGMKPDDRVVFVALEDGITYTQKASSFLCYLTTLRMAIEATLKGGEFRRASGFGPAGERSRVIHDDKGEVVGIEKLFQY